mgnify:FL=1|jgi:hypothetical protein
MERKKLIQEVKELIETGEITDIEGYIRKTEYSRTKATSLLNNSDVWGKIKIGKRFIYIKL